MFKYAESENTSFFLWEISKMSINRPGETTVELATQNRKSFVFLHYFSCFRQFCVFTGRSLALVQIHNNTYAINSKITQLHVAYEIRNQFDIGLNATYAKMSGKWNEITKWSGVTVSQLI